MQTLAERIVDKLLDEYYHPGMEPHDETLPCPQCGGEGQQLGGLGLLYHYRCRQCGWDFTPQDVQQEPPQAPPKANIMPGGSPGPVGDTSTIGFGAGGA